MDLDIGKAHSRLEAHRLARKRQVFGKDFDGRSGKRWRAMARVRQWLDQDPARVMTQDGQHLEIPLVAGSMTPLLTAFTAARQPPN
ncbi:hypothetical protein [Streptomyces sp. NPDC020362]|uniref:hypothetical protein n=1 Tax=unclassified Streptomyces TaxID=2593676 RepID=UPI0033F1523C